MISVDFLQTNDDTRKIKKTYTILYSGVSCDIYDSCDMYAPTLKVREDYAISANYIYISNFHRYYYIVNKYFDKAKTCTIECKCDVLKSFSTDILNSTQMIIRSADIDNVKVKNSLIPDTMLPVSPLKLTGDIQVTGKSIRHKDCYILTVLSGSTGTFATNQTPAEQGEYLRLDDGTILQKVRG